MSHGVINYSGRCMRNLTTIVGVAVWLCVIVAGCSNMARDYEAGKREYESKCATCHGAGGKGDGPQAQMLPTQPADLTLLAKDNGGVFPARRLYEIIDGRREVAAHGPRTMPVWGRFFQVDVPELPSDATGTVDFRETAVRDRIQVIIDYISRLQESY